MSVELLGMRALAEIIAYSAALRGNAAGRCGMVHTTGVAPHSLSHAKSVIMADDAGRGSYRKGAEMTDCGRARPV